MRTPRRIDLELTARCNLRCRYCYYFGNDAVPYEDIPTPEWLRFIEELGREGVIQANLGGGEPFLREDLPVLIDALVASRMRFDMVSNGGRITDALAGHIAQSGRCDGVQISVDGSHAATHDSARGKGSFEGAIRGIRILQAHGIPVRTRITLHRENARDVGATVRMLVEEYDIQVIGTNAVGYLGSCRANADALQLDVPTRVWLMAELQELSERYPGRLQAMAGPQAEAQMWPEMVRKAATNAPSTGGTGYLTGCGCPFNKITVRTDGAYVPCTMLAHLELGRINRDSLREVWQQAPILRDLRNRRQIPLSQYAECRECPYRPYCTGNCPGLAYSETGEIDRPAPDACLKRFLDAGGRLPESPVREASPP